MGWKIHDFCPKVQAQIREHLGAAQSQPQAVSSPEASRPETGSPPQRIRQDSKPLLNKLEARYRQELINRGYNSILDQAITLRLDPPFTSYRPDLVYMRFGEWIFVETKGAHRFREKGIAKAALAAKTYPMFHFELVQWINGSWSEQVLTP